MSLVSLTILQNNFHYAKAKVVKHHELQIQRTLYEVSSTNPNPSKCLEHGEYVSSPLYGPQRQQFSIPGNSKLEVTLILMKRRQSTQIKTGNRIKTELPKTKASLLG
jgi:hypothetical protein